MEEVLDDMGVEEEEEVTWNEEVHLEGEGAIKGEDLVKAFRGALKTSAGIQSLQEK